MLGELGIDHFRIMAIIGQRLMAVFRRSNAIDARSYRRPVVVWTHT
jgi:hypothetical protein